MNDLVSIIIPVYNVKRYLHECINSVINQTYSNIEIILVDDGSTDGSGQTCDEYSQKDNRILVKHKENGGLSDARNYGLNFASGKYVAFIDSDDYIDVDYIRLLYNAILENKTLVSQCALNIVDSNGNNIGSKGDLINAIKSYTQLMEEICSEKWENTVVWNKLYLKNLFNEVKFPKGKIHEDEFTTYKIFYDVKNVAVIEERLYNYRKHGESITGEKFNKKRLNVLEALEERILFFKSKDEDKLYALSIIKYLESLRCYYIKVNNDLTDYKDIRGNIKQKYRKYYKYILKSKYIGSVRKIKLFLFYINPDLFWKIKYISKGMK